MHKLITKQSKQNYGGWTVFHRRFDEILNVYLGSVCTMHTHTHRIFFSSTIHKLALRWHLLIRNYLDIQNTNKDMGGWIGVYALFSCTFFSLLHYNIEMMLMTRMAHDYIEALSMLWFNNIRSIWYVCDRILSRRQCIHCYNLKMIQQWFPLDICAN